ncbi:hypothetical protein [Leisingera daeponensis]|uniref:hypothetical protein n=1 Tax=Leisingera daeponensis TaxID=405746 RepID=UPI001C980E86|nr:hypothetical protein [Leisingera daeponensis]MBY6057822.1 hypothetical protein [Leisingera daeponensis]
MTSPQGHFLRRNTAHFARHCYGAPGADSDCLCLLSAKYIIKKGRPKGGLLAAGRKNPKQYGGFPHKCGTAA